MKIHLETSRLILRDWKESDLAPFARLNADPVVMEHFPAPLNEEQSAAFVSRIRKHLSERGYGLYAVEEKESAEFLGYVGMQDVTFEESFTPCIEVGWRLRKESWRRGYATEAAKACLKQGFSQLNLPAIHSFTAFYNLPSQRVMQKIDLRPLGSFDHPKVPEGHHLRPHVLYGITKEEFQQKEK